MVTTSSYGARPGLLDPFGSACAAVRAEDLALGPPCADRWGIVGAWSACPPAWWSCVVELPRVPLRPPLRRGPDRRGSRRGAEVRCGSVGNRTGDAEADVVDPEGGMTPAPYRGPAAPVLVEPTSAAEHSVGAVHLGVVDIPAPLPDVAQHVEQPPGVGLLAAHRVQSSLRVAADRKSTRLNSSHANISYAVFC